MTLVCRTIYIDCRIAEFSTHVTDGPCKRNSVYYIGSMHRYLGINNAALFSVFLLTYSYRGKMHYGHIVEAEERVWDTLHKNRRLPPILLKKLHIYQIFPSRELGHFLGFVTCSLTSCLNYVCSASLINSLRVIHAVNYLPDGRFRRFPFICLDYVHVWPESWGFPLIGDGLDYVQCHKHKH